MPYGVAIVPMRFGVLFLYGTFLKPFLAALLAPYVILYVKKDGSPYVILHVKKDGRMM